MAVFPEAHAAFCEKELVESETDVEHEAFVQVEEEPL